MNGSEGIAMDADRFEYARYAGDDIAELRISNTGFAK